MITASQL